MNRPNPTGIQAAIRPLLPTDLAGERMQRHFRFDVHEVAAILEANPGSSFWVPATDELIVVGDWRHRADLHVIHGLVATHHESALIEAASEQARSRGVKALLMIDISELRRPAFYERHGFRTIDRIATYELAIPGRPAAPAVPMPDLEFVQVRVTDDEHLAAIENLDHRAFPWFWWNVAAEFEAYLALEGVEIWAGLRDGRVVSYIGITHYQSWGHLDRIATDPEFQGNGIGRASLEMAIERLRLRGARRIALSTQGANASAQRLYERRGFRRTPTHDYTVRGIILDERVLEAITPTPTSTAGEEDERTT